MQTEKKKNANILVNLAVVFISLVFTILFMEFIIFRFVLPAAEVPENEFVEGLIKYKPNQKGIFRERGGIKASFKINSSGWNSRYDSYIKEKAGKFRIAIIGDSYVEALMVDYDKSLAEQLESRIGGDSSEVYRFGMSGAPLSQYFQILKKEVISYLPDLVVIVLVHNDFDESYKFVRGRYTSSFLKLKIDNYKVVSEIQPAEYEKKWYEFFRKSAIFRYLVYTQHFDIGMVKNFLLGKGDVEKTEYQANINIAGLKEESKNNEAVLDFIFKEIKELGVKHNFNILLLMDGDRDSIYKGVDSGELYNKGVLSLNSLALNAAMKHQISFIDMHPLFYQDYRLNKKKFNFDTDGHWNEYGHKIAADAVYNYLAVNRIFK